MSILFFNQSSSGYQFNLFLFRYLSQNGQQSILLHVLRGKVDLKLADALGASSKTEAMKRVEHVLM